MLGPMESLAVFIKNYNQEENSQFGCSLPVIEVRVIKNKPVWKTYNSSLPNTHF